MVLLFLPQLIMLIGLVIYLLSSNAKAQEVGRLMFFAGLLATCFNGPWRT